MYLGHPKAAGLRNKREKPQTHEKLGFYPVRFHAAGRPCVAERALDEMQWSDGTSGKRRELEDKILDKNANKVKVMASITRLHCFQ